jgi:hypothetical protein
MIRSRRDQGDTMSQGISQIISKPLEARRDTWSRRFLIIFRKNQPQGGV